MTVSIFVPGVGQYDNIGDIILRRQLIDWLRPMGDLHIYVGNSPDGYDGGLRVTPEDTLYRSFGSWYLAGLKSAAAGKTSYVFKPGEIQLTIIGMKEHVAMLPLAALVRLRGGTVARVGVGSRNFAPIPRALLRPSIALSQVTAWRDAETADYLKGAVMPDLAFGEGSTEIADDMTERTALIVEMRSDRPYPGAAWLDAVRTYAAEHGLEIWAVTQVLRDSERSRQLAADLGGSILDWNGTGHEAQELALRELYARTAVAISDRLHVLVTAFTEGAVPVALLVDRSGKIERHFAAAGITGVAALSEGLTAEQLSAHIDSVVSRRQQLFARLGGARNELGSVRAKLDRLITRQDAR